MNAPIEMPRKQWYRVEARFQYEKTVEYREADVYAADKSEACRIAILQIRSQESGLPFSEKYRVVG